MRMPRLFGRPQPRLWIVSRHEDRRHSHERSTCNEKNERYSGILIPFQCKRVTIKLHFTIAGTLSASFSTYGIASDVPAEKVLPG